MKKNIILALSCILVLSSCNASKNNSRGVIEYCNVTFVYNNGQRNTTVRVEKGDTVSRPSNPLKDKYIFDDWYKNYDSENGFDFSTPVMSDFALSAHYLVDYKSVTESIYNSVIKSNISVYADHYLNSSYLGTGQGSGFIFHETTKHYFAITNNHVVTSEIAGTTSKYSVTDYAGYTYSATVMYTSSTCDLAFIGFEKKDNELIVLDKYYTKNISLGTDVIALGQPKGLKNSVTYGSLLSYCNPPVIAGLEVTCEILVNNCFINHGSSGGALIDVDNFALVGVNYGFGSDKNGNYVCTYSIPASTVHNFISEAYSFFENQLS